jgi:hypothetical protein
MADLPFVFAGGQNKSGRFPKAMVCYRRIAFDIAERIVYCSGCEQCTIRKGLFTR